jgi:hypothetical protein
VKRRIVGTVGRIWESDRGLTVFLVVLVLTVFVLPAVFPPGSKAALAFDALFTLLVITGVVGISSSPVVRRSLIAAVIVSLGIRWLGWIAPSQTLDVLSAVSWVVTTGLLASVVLKKVFAAGAVNTHRILGAIAAYILIALTWAGAYAAVAAGIPESFRGLAAGHRVDGDLLYYSVITLTTVGYGDITPVHGAARSLAAMEALTGQLYLAILLARLVTLAGGKPDGEKRPGV